MAWAVGELAYFTPCLCELWDLGPDSVSLSFPICKNEGDDVASQGHCELSS